MTRSTLAVACLVAIAGACRSKEAPAEPPVPPSVQAEDLKALAASAEEQAVRLRGIAPKEPVKTEVVSKDAVERYVVSRIEDTDARTMLAVTSRMLAAFGALDRGTDLEVAVKGFIREQVAGYYDWEKKTLYVADWIPEFLQKPTLVHEVTHALQDQHFGLGRFMDPIPGCSEPQAAVQALIEGDATQVMAAAMLPGGMEDGEVARLQASLFESMMGQMQNLPGLEAIPPVLRETFFFPYTAGFSLVVEARAKGGAKALDALFANPPISTEQVMHPEKLLGAERDNPRDVILDLDALPPGRTLGGTDILGELGLALVLEQSMPRAEARAAAAGWDGDRFVLLGGGEDLMVFASVWDTPDDAAEAEAALRRTKIAPSRLLRREALVVGLWGPVGEEEGEKLVEAAIRGMTLEEMTTFDGWRKAAEARKR